jgi:hypothetical protein
MRNVRKSVSTNGFFAKGRELRLKGRLFLMGGTIFPVLAPKNSCSFRPGLNLKYKPGPNYQGLRYSFILLVCITS